MNQTLLLVAEDQHAGDEEETPGSLWTHCPSSDTPPSNERLSQATAGCDSDGFMSTRLVGAGKRLKHAMQQVPRTAGQRYKTASHRLPILWILK